MEEGFEILEPDLTLAEVKPKLRPISWFLENNIPILYYTLLDLLDNYLAKKASLPRILQRTRADEIVSLLIKDRQKLENYNKKLTNMFPGLYLGINSTDPNLIGPVVQQNATLYIHGLAGISPLYPTAMAGLGAYGVQKLYKNDKLGLNIPTAITGAMFLPLLNNYSKLNRYVVDNLDPRSYSIRGVKLVGKSLVQPLYKHPPYFYNGRKPAWYTKNIRNFSNAENEVRFLNEAIWADIPETEVPRTYFVKNKDSSIRPTDEAIATFKLAGVPLSNELRLMISGLDELVKKEPGSVTLGPDAFSSLGGEHSTYTYIGYLKDENGIPTVLFTLTDKQELNPQWILSSKIKNKFKLNPNSFTYKTVDKLGGINLSRLIGFKPFTLKLGIAVQPGKGDYNIKYFDPTGLN